MEVQWLLSCEWSLWGAGRSLCSQLPPRNLLAQLVYLRAQSRICRCGRDGQALPFLFIVGAGDGALPLTPSLNPS